MNGLPQSPFILNYDNETRREEGKKRKEEEETEKQNGLNFTKY